jgi:hypothetical protein
MSINRYLTPADGTPALRDYRHAARIFTDDNFRLSPKYGFLFYVEFVFNPDISLVSNDSRKELGMIVKSCSLPKFSIDTKTHNAYNRKNIVTNKIAYDPVSITFHDDQSDTVKNFWYDYYSFFFRDPDYAESTYNAAHKYQSRSSFDWGYTPRPTVGSGVQPYQYIQSIKIYSLYQKNFSEYQLINPTITSFRHGDHANGDSNILENQMTVQFETVKYLTGYTTSNTVGGYVDLHYDNTPSPIAPADGVGLVDNGMGGYSNAPDTVTDMASSTVLVKGDVGIALTPINNGINSIGSAFATSFASATNFAASGVGGTGSNFGGFTIPTLGGLTQGITNGAILAQQAQATAVNLAGSLANNAANGVIGGLTAGLGENGGAIVNIVAAAIQNPKALVATATNMAAAYAMQEVSGKVTSLVQGGIDEASGWIKDQVGELRTTLATSFGDNLQGLQTSLSFGSSGTTLFDGISNGGIADGSAAPAAATFESAFGGTPDLPDGY